MAKIYKPPTQSGIGQFIDSIFLIVLVYGSLMMPLLFNFGGSDTTPPEKAAVTKQVTWESLHQNKVAAGQWEKLGYTPKKAADIINTRFDYTIDPVMLGITALIMLVYFGFVLRFSEKEYRDVIAEHFSRNRQ